MSHFTKWMPADYPPDAEHGCWSREVIVVTNLGNVLCLAYWHPQDDAKGHWQRPRGMLADEVPDLWTNKPQPTS